MMVVCFIFSLSLSLFYRFACDIQSSFFGQDGFLLQSQTILILATVKKWIYKEFLRGKMNLAQGARKEEKKVNSRQSINKQINKQTKRKVISFYSGVFSRFFFFFFICSFASFLFNVYNL